jgi:hypothetical protein
MNMEEVRPIQDTPTSPRKSTPLNELKKSSKNVQESGIPPALNQFVQQSSNIQQVPRNHTQQLPLPPMSQMAYDASGYNKQMEQEQKIQMLVNELKKQRQQAPPQETYWDKLLTKKKELLKFLQSALIVLFAISIHVVVDHYLKVYLENNDVSYERELFIRLLYPFAILFLAWNIVAFIK